MNCLLAQTQFNGRELNIIDHQGKKWLTAEDVGNALDYTTRQKDAINNLYNRHSDEFTDEDQATVKLMSPSTSKDGRGGGAQTTRIFSLSGCVLLAFTKKGYQ